MAGATSIGYAGAGTMEFLLDHDGNLAFMEMNARIQVEHPVSEMITDCDLIQEQIRVAAGEKLSVSQDDVVFQGHSIECRINAEDPDADFAPTAGRLETYVPPGGPWTRVDSHCYPGWMISPFYDSLIAKLIVWAPDRERAIDRMARALDEFEISGRGVKTTIPFHQKILQNEQFRSGDVTTDFDPGMPFFASDVSSSSTGFMTTPFCNTGPGGTAGRRVGIVHVTCTGPTQAVARQDPADTD